MYIAIKSFRKPALYSDLMQYSLALNPYVPYARYLRRLILHAFDVCLAHSHMFVAQFTAF
jgi:hypothetical protein